MILITGATGNLGSKVIKPLQEKALASQIAALVRDDDNAKDLKKIGISIRVGDYDNKVALREAMKGVIPIKNSCDLSFQYTETAV